MLRVGMGERGRRRGEHPLVQQVVLGLLLRERVEPAPRAERAQEPDAVGAVHVVSLPADADQGDRARRMPITHVAQLRGDLRDRRVPRDALEGAVGLATQRVPGPLRVLDVGPDAKRLVADVALGDGIVLVRAHLDDLAATDVDAQAAVVAAQHARGRDVVGVERERGARHGRIDGLGLHHEVSFFSLIGCRPRSAGPGRARMSRAGHGLGAAGTGEHRHRPCQTAPTVPPARWALPRHPPSSDRPSASSRR